jgi:hypothetical protein
MKKQMAISVVFFAVLVALAMAAQDKYTVKVHGGLAFSAPVVCLKHAPRASSEVQGLAEYNPIEVDGDN